MEKLSSSHEDYIEAIVMLAKKPGEPVRAVDIAEKLDVSKASVSKAVSWLKERGLVEQQHYGTITLTEEGFDYGRKILDRHEALTTFLSKGLGIDPVTAEEEACMMEHAISDDSFEKWMAFIHKMDL